MLFRKHYESFPIYIVEKDLKSLETEFPDNRWNYLTKTLEYPYEYFNRLDEHQKPVKNIQKEDSFSKLEKRCLSDEEIERTKENIKI